ncbi:MAG: hypothetical protein AABY32_07395 [Nanoarchaeota archaeon]
MEVVTDELEIIKNIKNKYFIPTKSDEQIFYDLCFCLCVPQITYRKNKKIQDQLKSFNFYANDIPLEQLYITLKPTRFYRNKTKSLLNAKNKFNFILDVVRSNKTELEKRKLLVDNIFGFGMKTSSHFLRNQGAIDLAIIDTHILKYLNANQPRNKKEYLFLEDVFRNCAKGNGLSVVELDMMIWKSQSGISWDEFII